MTPEQAQIVQANWHLPTRKAIGALAGLSVEEVSRVGRAYKLPPRKPGRRHRAGITQKPRVILEICRLLKSGMTITTVATRYGVAPATISTLARNNGFPVRKMREMIAKGEI